LLNGGFQAGEGLFTLVARLFQLALLGALFVNQGLLLALSLPASIFAPPRLRGFS
jgi:hypothetical protein